jgi:hypothetical protein
MILISLSILYIENYALYADLNIDIDRLVWFTSYCKAIRFI